MPGVEKGPSRAPRATRDRDYCAGWECHDDAHPMQLAPGDDGRGQTARARRPRKHSGILHPVGAGYAAQIQRPAPALAASLASALERRLLDNRNDAFDVRAAGVEDFRAGGLLLRVGGVAFGEIALRLGHLLRIAERGACGSVED